MLAALALKPAVFSGVCLEHGCGPQTAVVAFLGLQEQDDAAEHAGPLAEIDFWRSRTVDLGGIRDQLDDKSMPLQAI
jgi:hypothetical protein